MSKLEDLPDVRTPAHTGYPYSEAELATVERITQWLQANGKSRSWLGKRANVASATLSQILSTKYPSNPAAQLRACIAAIEVETERMADGPAGYVKGSVHKLVAVVCDRTRKHRNFGVVCGFVGVGKTRSLKEYRAAKSQTLLIEVSPNMTPGVLLTDLLHQLGTAVPPGLDRKFKEVVRVISGTNMLIILDEAEKSSELALEYVRRIRDMAEVGVVLVGTEKLMAKIKPHHSNFDQIRSRVSMWPRTIETITRDDADEMARAGLTDVEVSDDVLDSLWDYCAGSARVLNESLIPAIKDYGTGNKHALTPALVDSIAAKVLFMTKHRKGEV